jgi:uncharacterized protein (TIGR03437 family)
LLSKLAFGFGLASLLFLLLGAQILSPRRGQAAKPAAQADQDLAAFVRREPTAERSEIARQMFARLLDKARTSGPVRVIIGLKAAFESEGRLRSETAIRSQRVNIAQAQERLLGRLAGYNPASVKRFEFIPFLALEVDADTLRQLADAPDVVSIEEDAVGKMALAESVPLIGAPAAWAAGFSGAGQHIAILDTGVDKNHPFLAGKVVSEACYSTNGNNVSSLCTGGVKESTAAGSGVNCPPGVDGCFHGTFVAGIAAGKGPNFSGVARDAKIIAIQVASQFNRQSDCGSAPSPCASAFNSDVIKGMERALALSNSFNIAAVNLSIGLGKATANCDAFFPAYKAAIDNLRSRGIATVIASGNESYTDGLSAPACISTAISVGATGDGSVANGVNAIKDVVAPFSNGAPFLSLLAPGMWINSSVPGGGFEVSFGTSFAAPHVAGAWAVLKQKAPDASVSRALSALATTGLPVTDTRNNVNIQKPRIRLDAALTAITSSDPGQELELSADDGSGEGSLSLLDGRIVVNRLTPTVYPATLRRIRIFFDRFQNQPDPTGKPISLVYFTEPGGSGRPPAGILLTRVNVTVPGIGGFFDFPIANGPTITAGDFYVGYQSPSPHSGVGFLFDFDGAPQNRSFLSNDNGANFQGPLTPPPGAASANALIRAEISTSSSCDYRLSSTSNTFSNSGGSGASVSVSAASGCQWTARSNVSWITITAGGGGNGNGAVTYTVASNTGAGPRVGTMTIAGQTFTVTQSCVAAISADKQYVAAGGGGGSVSVTANGGCGWEAASNASWLTVTSGAAAAGNGTVTYSAQPNTSSVSRSGELTIAGNNLTVIQLGTGSACAVTPIRGGQTVNGTLSDADCLSSVIGGRADRYSFTGAAGQTVTISLQSAPTLTALFLIGPQGTVIAETAFLPVIPTNDANITGLRLPASGAYIIEVASSSALGGYTLKLTAPNSSITDTLAIDDGTAEGGFAADGWRAVNRLTPTRYPSKLEVIRIFFWIFNDRPNPGGTQIQLIAFAGAPGTNRPPNNPPLLLNQTVTIPFVPDGGAFFDFPIANGPTINSGDWYIGFRSPNPAGGVGTWFDTSGLVAQRSFVSYDGVTYEGPLKIDNGPLTNLMIRAEVSAPVCSYALSPSNQNFSASGGNGGVQVTTSGGCVWAAAGDADWIKITSSATGSGNGQVSYTVQANPTTSQRTGKIIVAGQTVTITQAGVACAYTLSKTSEGFSASGGKGSVSVDANCSWFPSSNVSWIEIVEPIEFPPNSWNSVFSYTVAANLGASSRSGTITVGDKTLTVTQAGAPDTVPLASGAAQTGSIVAPPAQLCTLSPTQYTIQTPNAAANLLLLLQGGGASPNIDLYARFGQRVAITSGSIVADYSAKSAGGSLESLTISPSSSPPIRQGVYYIAVNNCGPGAANFTLRATVCTLALSTTNQNFAAGGGDGSVNVIAGSNCNVNWTATSNANWITIATGASGQSNGVVTYTVAPNTTISPRTGTMTIAGQTFTITQAGASCTYAIAPASRSFGAGGGNGSVNVTALDGCNWTATSNLAWVKIDSGASGAGNGSVSFSVSANLDTSPRSGALTVAGQTFTVMQAGAAATARVIRVVSASGVPGGPVNLPIELEAQGDESALGFSLTFDPTILSNPQVTLGDDAVNATPNTNLSQVAQGRLGILVTLAAGQVFQAGVKQVARVTFTINGGAPPMTAQVGFGDQPIAREVSNVSAGILPANYTAGVVTITQGYEGDVAPRPSGNGTVTATDWVQIGRFIAGIETAAPGGEFQRADVAPKETFGNGLLTATDWVQAGRYAAGLDPLVPAGGPTGPGSFAGDDSLLPSRGLATADQAASVVRIAPASLERGQNGSVVIELAAQGGENAIGFSVSFDASQLRFVSAGAGKDATGATLNVNVSQAGNGRVGILLAMSTGQSLPAGTRQIVVLNFAAAANSNVTTTTMSFGDLPVAREIADASARVVAANFNNGSITLTRTVAAVSAASFLGAELAPESIVAAFGANLATEVKIANAIPLPTNLGGTKIVVKDSAGVERPSPLFFVSPNQVNYLIPSGSASGSATITSTTGEGVVSTGKANIASVTPALFTANSSGQGLVSGVALRVKPDGRQIYEPIGQFDPAQNRVAPVPIDLGPEGDQVFLILYGTGVRFRSSLSAVTASVGGMNSQVLYAGVADGFVGLDQINLALPRSLAGRGDVEIKLSADGKAANTVTIKVK